MTTEIYKPQNLPPESFNAIKQLYIEYALDLQTGVQAHRKGARGCPGGNAFQGTRRNASGL